MRCPVVALLILLGLPAGVAAQTIPPREPVQVPVEIRSGETPPEAKLGRVTAPPVTQTPAAVSEAERAAAELEQTLRDRQLLREQTSQVPRRPDLGYDVSSGIQQRNLLRALPR